jgi:hypothetical protein
MKALQSFRIWGTIHPRMQHNIPEDVSPQWHHYENLKLLAHKSHTSISHSPYKARVVLISTPEYLFVIYVANYGIIVSFCVYKLARNKSNSNTKLVTHVTQRFLLPSTENFTARYYLYTHLVVQICSCSRKKGRRFEVMWHSTNFGQFWEIFIFDFVAVDCEMEKHGCNITYITDNTQSSNNDCHGNLSVRAHTSWRTQNLITTITMETWLYGHAHYTKHMIWLQWLLWQGGYKEIHVKENIQPGNNGNLGVQVWTSHRWVWLTHSPIHPHHDMRWISHKG